MSCPLFEVSWATPKYSIILLITYDKFNNIYRIDVDINLDTVTSSAVSALKKAKELKLHLIAKLLTIVCVLPVTSNEAERSFSRLKIVKSSLRATMTNKRLVICTEVWARIQCISPCPKYKGD